jgi:PAS domain S-box-containing protein
MTCNSLTSTLEERGAEIMKGDLHQSRVSTDRLFALLMVLQWIAAMVLAFAFTPTTWTGADSKIHIHVWSAIVLGFLLSSLPVLLAWCQPGAVATRHTIAAAQMLFASLFVHLSTGRIETHFLIFVSLACLAFYCDWRVLATATTIVTLDHFIRGFWWPQTVFGVLTASPWRSVEHASWVLLEDLFLIVACRERLRSLSRVATREAELEILSRNFEAQVQIKTVELVTAREVAEKALSEISALRYALDQHALLSFADRDGKITDANAGFCRVSGYSREELLGHDHRIFNSSTHPCSFWEDMWNTISSGKLWRNEICNRAKDGSLFWVDSTIIPQLGADGVPEKYVSLRFDITGKKCAEEAVRLANLRYQQLAAAVERSPDCTIVTDLDGNVQFANPAARQLAAMFGHDTQIGCKAFLFTKDRIDSAIRLRLVETVSKGKVFSEQFECRYDGSGKLLEFGDHCSTRPTKMLSVTASPLVNDAGEIDGILLAKRDITDDIIRQRSLEEITTAMDAATDCVFIVDVETLNFVYINQGAVKHCGYSMDEMRHMTPMHIDPSLDHRSFRKLTDQFEASPGLALNLRSEHQHRDGHRIPVAISLQLIPQLGRNGRYLAIVRDITEQLASEKALEAAKELAETSSRSKSEFLANMSHEIRTPMTAILGFTDLLLDSRQFYDEPERRIHAIQTIQRNGDHLLGLINDILDLSKIEAGKLEVESIDYSPIAIADEVLSLMRVRSAAKGIHLDSVFETPVPKTIRTDPTRLRQVILNLVSNAIKFTEIGSVQIIVRLVGGAVPKLEFDVVDTGMGMTQEHQERLFKPFTQADTSTTRQFGGTGLGLTISKRLAEMMGGNVIIADSVPGVGTRFRATISVGSLAGVELVNPSRKTSIEIAPIDASKTDEVLSPLKGCRILFAEDGPDNQRLISFVLQKAGAEVTVVENGQLAVDAALQAFNIDRPFHVILMDMQMPVLDGYGAAALLRAKEYRGPIIALTAHAMDSDRAKCLNSGCDDYSTKPIVRLELIKKLALIFQRQKINLVEIESPQLWVQPGQPSAT